VKLELRIVRGPDGRWLVVDEAGEVLYEEEEE